MITFYEIQDAVLAKFGKDIVNKATFLKDYRLVKSYINDIQETVYQYNMPFMKKEGVITLKSKYTASTITVVNGSATITGAATVWTCDMVGQLIIISGVAYRIAGFTSTLILTLDSPYIGTGAAGLSYAIYYDTYTLPIDFKTLEDIGNENQDIEILELDEQKYYLDNIDTTTTIPEYAKFLIKDSSLYNTGTVTVSSTTVTGTSTAWDSSLVGKYIQIGTYGKLYKITAASATSITIDSAYGGTITTTMNYKIEPQGLMTMRFYYAPSVAFKIPFIYWQKEIAMYDDSDISPIPSDSILVDGTIWKMSKADDTQLRITNISADRFKFDFDEKIARLGGIKTHSSQNSVVEYKG